MTGYWENFISKGTEKLGQNSNKSEAANNEVLLMTVARLRTEFP
jgi:hypothetical protein